MDGFNQADRSNELMIEANRIIERCLVDSRCLDLESLCIISGEVVWEVRLDIRVLNHEGCSYVFDQKTSLVHSFIAGNLIDACCISAISALCHFKRPDVTVFASEEIQMQSVDSLEESRPSAFVYGRLQFHSSKEKALVSLNIQHIPVCVTLCFFDQGKGLIVDPTRCEELSLEGAQLDFYL